MASVIRVDIQGGDDTLTPQLDRAGAKMKDFEKNANAADVAINNLTNTTLKFAQAALNTGESLGIIEGRTGILAQGFLNLATSGNVVNAVLSVMGTITRLIKFDFE